MVWRKPPIPLASEENNRFVGRSVAHPKKNVLNPRREKKEGMHDT
jgi:hypothetical protein